MAKLPSHDIFTMPDATLGSPQEIYRFIQNQLEGNSAAEKNMATFASVQMEEEAVQLAVESLGINLADKYIYRKTNEFRNRIVQIIASLTHADQATEHPGIIGTTTVGSTEAVLLSVLTHKTRWLEWFDSLPEEQKPDEGRAPNMVMGACSQACWEKAFKYFDLHGLPKKNQRSRILPLTNEHRILTADRVRRAIEDGVINENTICLSLILGTTQTGEFDEIVEINEVIRAYNDQREAACRLEGKPVYRIPIHIDAAYGGFIFPFTRPEYAWDFRASEVQSINISNHKFGMVFPGLGTVVFRDKSTIPSSLYTEVEYLGESFLDFGLNFSQPSWPVVCQYYNFLRMGHEGYQAKIQQIIANAELLVQSLEKIPSFSTNFELLTQVDSAGKLYFPNVVFKLKEGASFKVNELSAKVQRSGWTIPAYHLPSNQENISVIRLVVKDNMSPRDVHELVEAFKKSFFELLEKEAPENDAESSPKAVHSPEVHQICS